MRTAAHADDEVVRVEPFVAVEIDLLVLWGEERPPSAGTASNAQAVSESQPAPALRPEPAP